MTITETERQQLRDRYADERDKRLRDDHDAQYIALTDEFGDYFTDPHQPVVEREPVSDHVTFTFLGGGFAGLVTGARLKQQGIEDVRIVDLAGDFGGTWYWNRYPGVMCDTVSLVYLPLLEETGHVPTEKYTHGPEILEHARRIGRTFDLYDHALFHTAVTELRWDDEAGHWIISTDRGDRFTSTFVGVGTGPFPAPKLPGIPGVRSFRGHSFHASRWDYDYTGGDNEGAPMEGLRGKRVGIIGTGATTIQALPELAKTAEGVYVFQRTPSAVEERGNRPITEEWFAEIDEPGWQQRFYDNFAQNWDGVLGIPGDPDLEDLVEDAWTAMGRRTRAVFADVPPEELYPERMMEIFEDADFEKMNEIRDRVDSIVRDPVTATALKPWYQQLCKRPTFHDEYLQAYNRDNVHLVDTDGKGPEAITETGIRVDGRDIELDCIIYATGFMYQATFEDANHFEIVGREGRTLAEEWMDGMETLHGTYTHGFPNLFLQQIWQGAFIGSNVTQEYAERAWTIAAVVDRARSTGGGRFEATKESQDAWVDLLLDQGRMFGTQACTPGYYNNEGREPTRVERLYVGYPGGSFAFFEMMRDWRTNGAFEGLSFDQALGNDPGETGS